MKISVIIPVYNVEKYLHQCINSVLEQNFTNYEIILVDDGATDNSGIICDEYAQKYPNINVIHKENGGLSDARNFGIKQAKGEYLIFLDSDDFWQGKEVLSDINKIIEKQNPDLILFGFTQFINGEKNITLDSYTSPKQELTYNFHTDFGYLVNSFIYKASSWDKVIRRDIVIQNNLYFPKGKLHEDIAWCYDIIEHIKTYSIYPNCFYCYRRNRKGSITYKFSDKSITDIIDIIYEKAQDLPNSKNKNSFLFLWGYAIIIIIIINRLPKEIYNAYFEKVKKTSFILKQVPENLSWKHKIRLLVYKLIGIKLAGKLEYKLRNPLK